MCYFLLLEYCYYYFEFCLQSALGSTDGTCVFAFGIFVPVSAFRKYCVHICTMENTNTFFMKLVSVPLKKGGPRIVIARMHISVRNAIIFPGKLCHTNECCQLNKHTRSDHV